MGNKNIMIHSVVAAGATDPYETPAIPAGKIWVLKNFGAADINLGDSKSSVYVLMFGTEVIRIISLTGNTREIPLKKEITGDGAKKVKILRMNKSGEAREMPVWLTAYQRQ